jgi:hypothetical protein
LDKKCTTFFYEENIPFNVVQCPTFIEVVKATSESWTYYKPLSHHRLCTNLLKQSKVDVSKHVITRIWNSIHKYGTTICSNGWDNTTRHPLLNIMFAYLSGNGFKGSIDTTRLWKDMPITYVMHWLVQFNICLWMVHGLFDFHEIPQPWIIHWDIKANNILQPKIANFGLDVLFPKYQTHITTMHIVGKMWVISTY